MSSQNFNKYFCIYYEIIYCYFIGYSIITILLIRISIPDNEPSVIYNIYIYVNINTYTYSIIVI